MQTSATVGARGGSLGAMSAAIGDDRNERLRALLAKLCAERFEGNQAATARALGITGASLSDILAGKRGVGLGTLLLISDLVNESLDILVRGHPHRPEVRVERDDRYPARSRARARAREIFERADQAVATQAYARAEDKNEEWWMRRIEEAQVEARRELEDPEGFALAQEVGRRRAERTGDQDEAALAKAAADDDEKLLPRRGRKIGRSS